MSEDFDGWNRREELRSTSKADAQGKAPLVFIDRCTPVAEMVV